MKLDLINLMQVDEFGEFQPLLQGTYALHTKLTPVTDIQDIDVIVVNEPIPHRRTNVKRRVSVNEALREHLKLVILGDPGAGKTTVLKYIILTFAQSHSDRLGLAGEERLPTLCSAVRLCG